MYYRSIPGSRQTLSSLSAAMEGEMREAIDGTGAMKTSMKSYEAWDAISIVAGLGVKV